MRTSLGERRGTQRVDLRRALADNRDDLRALVANLRAASEIARRPAESDRAACRPRARRRVAHLERAPRLADRAAGLARRRARRGRRASSNSGTGTAAQLVNDRAAVRRVTRTAMRELSALVRDLRTNPKKYFKVSVF